VNISAKHLIFLSEFTCSFPKVANSGRMILSVGDGHNAFLEANKHVVIQAMLSFKWYA